MQKIMLTCPFTGVSFEALKDGLGNIYATNPLTGEKIRLAYEPKTDSYAISAQSFIYNETITQTQAANIISVSKARVSQLCQSGQLQSTNVNGTVLVSRESVETYRDSERKAGRRW